MVRWRQFSANRNPPFGVWRRKLYSVQSCSVVKQHSYGIAHLWYSRAVKTLQLSGGPRARQPWGQASLCSFPVCFVLRWFAPLCFCLLCSVPVCSALLPQDVFHVSAPARGTQSSVERGSVFSQPEENWLKWTEVPILGPWLVYPHASEDSKSSHFDWPKSHNPDWSE